MVEIQQAVQEKNLMVQKDSSSSHHDSSAPADSILTGKLLQQSATEGNQIDSTESASLLAGVEKGASAWSLFTGHELQPQHNSAIEKKDNHPGWFTILLLGLVMVIAYLRVSYPKRFSAFFRALADLRFASEMVREEKVLSQRISILLTLTFILSVASFAYFLSGYFGIQLFSGNSFLIFFKIAVSIFLLLFFRVLVVELVGYVFKAEAEFSFYSYHIFLFNQALGLFLIPVLIGFVYVTALPKSVFIFTGTLFFLISYISRLIRGLNIGLAKQGFNKFYLFFYFCTLEFLPAVILAKIILDHKV